MGFKSTVGLLGSILNDHLFHRKDFFDHSDELHWIVAVDILEPGAEIVEEKLLVNLRIVKGI